MRIFARISLILWAWLVLVTTAHAQFIPPPGPVPTTCTGGQGVTAYGGYGSTLTCGAFTATATINNGTQYHLGLYPNAGSNAVIGQSANITDNGSLLTIGEAIDFQTYTISVERPNDTTTGTTVNTLTTLTAAGKAIIVSHTAATQYLGITVAGAGTSSNAQIAVAGQPTVVFDGATTSGDLVQASTSVDGNAHDTGSATCPTNSAPVIGMVLSTHAGAGTYAIQLGSFGCGTAGLGGSSNGQILTNSAGNVGGLTIGGVFSTGGGTLTVASAGITSAMMGSGAAASNVGTLGGVLSGTLPNPSIAAGAVTNTMLANPSLTLGSTSVALGASAGVSGTSLTAVYLDSPVITGTIGGSPNVGVTNAPLLGTGAGGSLRAITLGTNLSMSGTTLNASGSGGSNVIWPSNNSLIISNLTNSPSGLAPVNNDLLYGVNGAWSTLATAANSIICTNASAAPSLCNSSTIQGLLGYITGNQSITLTGDTTGSGSTGIATTTRSVNGVAFPASPSTNTLPVVTSANNVSYYTAAQLSGVSGFGTMLQQNANAVAITGGSITGLNAPTTSTDAATKGYVDGAVVGSVLHTQVAAATAAVLPNTPSASGTGVGKTLQSSTNTALVVDGYTVLLNDRVLVKDQAAGADDGIYTETQLGTGSAHWILTRATDFDQATAGEVALGAYVFVANGTANSGTQWQLGSPTPSSITVDTTALTFNKLNANTTYTADESTVHLSGTQFAEKTNGTTNTQLAQMNANTMKANFTGSLANAADFSMPSCTDASGNHLNYVNGTGITCGTSTGISATAAGANIVITPSPGVGSFTVGTTWPINDQNAAGYAILTGDNGKTIYVGNHTYTLPQAGSAGFGAGWQACLLNTAGSGAATISTTTSLFAGASGTTSLTLNPGDWACPNSDATNWGTMFGHYTGGAAANDTVTTGIAAAGTTQGTATLISSQQNYVATGANCTTYATTGCAGNAGVRIDSVQMVAGNHLYVINEDANNALNVYPPSGDTINLFSVNLPYALQANNTAHFIVKSSSALRLVP